MQKFKMTPIFSISFLYSGLLLLGVSDITSVVSPTVDIHVTVDTHTTVFPVTISNRIHAVPSTIGLSNWHNTATSSLDKGHKVTSSIHTEKTTDSHEKITAIHTEKTTHSHKEISAIPHEKTTHSHKESTVTFRGKSTDIPIIPSKGSTKSPKKEDTVKTTIVENTTMRKEDTTIMTVKNNLPVASQTTENSFTVSHENENSEEQEINEHKGNSSKNTTEHKGNSSNNVTGIIIGCFVSLFIIFIFFALVTILRKRKVHSYSFDLRHKPQEESGIPLNDVKP
ncbi:uncharacterized protein ACNLHF_021178 isoform 4-T4 [Anomaloglossus baeobatrachus]|uniref:uncharacterized protein LOC142310594 isoform X4 n=1 Tax=Anomaloglossus baeobatrachus TaxID=238106 RepID=UPI003F4F6ABD